MGEFGRAPVINKVTGRDHSLNGISMVVACGGDVWDRRVAPSDLDAIDFRCLGIDQQVHWMNPQRRPSPIVERGGRPIHALCG
ncbi:MAG: DUF1501 domain-containing protein [Planctomycetia bacterium]